MAWSDSQCRMHAAQKVWLQGRRASRAPLDRRSMQIWHSAAPSVHRRPRLCGAGVGSAGVQTFVTEPCYVLTRRDAVSPLQCSTGEGLRRKGAGLCAESVSRVCRDRSFAA